ncbi:MAG TPA: TetR/AcrR family transcriptional regulator, partial [Thermoleophilaceae bacterium]|nr:TetR/AcrR family transcriptional regulator [Thermoleophilaceae bacterium]
MATRRGGTRAGQRREGAERRTQAALQPPGAAEGRPVRRRIPAPERRALILHEAGRLFARHGYAGTRLEDIAAAAHVTKPIVYRHFESKKALYVALLVKHRDDLPTFVEGGQLLSAILEYWLTYVRENSHAWVMIFRDPSGDDDIRGLRRDVNLRARQVLASFIAERAGDSVPADQVEPTAELLSSGLAGLALWWIDHPDTPME